jgi:hypothetical protein
VAGADAEPADVVNGAPAHGAVTDDALDLALRIGLHAEELCAQTLDVHTNGSEPSRPASIASPTIAFAFARLSVTRRTARSTISRRRPERRRE